MYLIVHVLLFHDIVLEVKAVVVKNYCGCTRYIFFRIELGNYNTVSFCLFLFPMCCSFLRPNLLWMKTSQKMISSLQHAAVVEAASPAWTTSRPPSPLSLFPPPIVEREKPPQRLSEDEAAPVML